MPTSALDIDTFLLEAATRPVFDVRTPAEYDQGRIPEAVNLPLFSNDERAEIGLLYKQQGREPAMRRSLDLVGPKLRSLIEQVELLTPDRQVLLYCWRGGMRSGSVAQLLAFFGYEALTLNGGYKSYRRFGQSLFEHPWSLKVVGGRTGSGKTDVLHALSARGEQVIDLEALACHKGSSFGALGQAPQPTQEQFENQLAWKLRSFDPHQRVWVEDESRQIGRCKIPHALWTRIQTAPTLVLDVPLETRIQHLINDYGRHDPDLLADAIQRIEKRLGGQYTKEALIALHENRPADVVRLVLKYYDKSYDRALKRRQPGSVTHVATPTLDADLNTCTLLNAFG